MKLLSATQASKVLHLDRSRVKALCAAGRIKGAYKVGNAWAVPNPPIVLPPQKRAHHGKILRIEVFHHD